MGSSTRALTVDAVTAELKRLRRGPALAHPAVVGRLTPRLRAHLSAGSDADDDGAGETLRLVAALRRAIDGLGRDERLHACVDFNLTAEHGYPTLTERQESLARQRRCTAKTVRRHADRALQTLALLLVTGEDGRRTLTTAPPTRAAASTRDAPAWRSETCRFWGLSETTGVDIVCSEIPPEERPAFAEPHDRNYLRYAKFADLDSLIYVRTRLAQACPGVTVRDFSPSEYFNTDTDRLIVIGGPPWNAKYREFLPQLPYHFEPHPLGEDDPLVVPCLADRTLGPRWTARHELLEDLAVFTRLTLSAGTTVFLLGGCLTLGVLGAAQLFLAGERGAANADYVTDQVGDRDFVLVTETRRVGGLTDVADLTTAGPLLLLAREAGGPFTVAVDHTDRYLAAR